MLSIFKGRYWREINQKADGEKDWWVKVWRKRGVEGQ